MSKILKYALRYAPLLILALLLIPLRISSIEKAQQHPDSSQQPIAASFSPGSALYSVTTTSNGEVWAVGGSFSIKSTTGQFPLPASGLLLHYVNGRWIAATVTKPLRLPLLGVSIDSPRDGWAVGWSGTLVHYDGNTWSTISNVTHFNQNLLGVIMLSAVNGWAVGYSGSILHYDGKQWTQMPSPTQFDLHGISMLSTQEGWAVGASGTILHYYNRMWSVVSSSPTSNTLRSVFMLSTQEGWAVGDSGTILHYRNGIWERVYSINQYQNPSRYSSVDLFGIAMDSIRSGWITSNQHLLRYRAEAWRESDESISLLKEDKYSVSIPGTLSLYSIATSPSGTGWAVGRVNDDKIVSNTFIVLQRQGNTWYKSLAGS